MLYLRTHTWLYLGVVVFNETCHYTQVTFSNDKHRMQQPNS